MTQIDPMLAQDKEQTEIRGIGIGWVDKERTPEEHRLDQKDLFNKILESMRKRGREALNQSEGEVKPK